LNNTHSVVALPILYTVNTARRARVNCLLVFGRILSLKRN